MPKKTKQKRRKKLKLRIGVLQCVFVISLLCWALGVFVGANSIAAFSLIELSANPALNLLLLTASVFIFSLLFFGSSAPLILFFVGIMQGKAFLGAPLEVIAGAIPLFIAAYAALVAGRYLYADFRGTGNFFAHKREMIALFGISIIAAVVIGAAS
ncbi:MAG: hypothetical protein J4415_03400 [Candidatus Diapherotrites archaeon]|uniref:Uncharacterized protein n=1 Tax=Candidatus Iainarchaeum sp. TaxID=3101447 RepID=A0A8T4KU57_9ARCH|nr:hypothetical protein [Candidatus Diapherotrites archaeon]